MSLFKIISILFFFISFSFKYALAEEKIAFLNIDLIFQNSITGKNITKKLDDFKKKNLNSLKSKEDEILKKEKKLLSQKNILSNDEFNLKVKDIKKEIALFNENKKKFSIEFENKRNDELKIFMESIRPIIEDYIKKNSISMVFNQKNLFIANKKYDITKDILKIINKES